MQRTLVVVIGCLAALAAGVARAEDRKAAEQMFRIGAEAYKAKRYDAAVENFEGAYQQYRAPEIAFSAAQAHRLRFSEDQQATHVARAIELFEQYLRDAPATAAKRKDAEAHLARLRDVMKGISASGQPVHAVRKDTPAIYVSVPIDNAMVTVDGKAVERYTWIDVPAGEHTVGVSADGYQPVEKKVPVKGQLMVPVELQPRPAAVSIKTQGDAKVVVDGRALALTQAPLEIAPGKRWVTVWARGREPVTRELDLKPGEEVTVTMPLHATGRRKAVKWVWLGTGVLAAATITTAALSISADFSAASLRDQAEPLSAADEARYLRLRDRRDGMRTTSLVLGGLSIAAAGAALFLYYADKPSGEDLAQPSRHDGGGFSPMAGAGGIGLSYTGGF